MAGCSTDELRGAAREFGRRLYGSLCGDGRGPKGVQIRHRAPTNLLAVVCQDVDGDHESGIETSGPRVVAILKHYLELVDAAGSTILASTTSAAI